MGAGASWLESSWHQLATRQQDSVQAGELEVCRHASAPTAATAAPGGAVHPQAGQCLQQHVNSATLPAGLPGVQGVCAGPVHRHGHCRCGRPGSRGGCGAGEPPQCGTCAAAAAGVAAHQLIATAALGCTCCRLAVLLPRLLGPRQPLCPAELAPSCLLLPAQATAVATAQATVATTTSQGGSACASGTGVGESGQGPLTASPSQLGRWHACSPLAQVQLPTCGACAVPCCSFRSCKGCGKRIS